MQLFRWFAAGLLTVGLAATAHAEEPATIAQDQFTVTAQPSQWISSGFIGSNFGASAEDPSLDFGGQVAYLWNGIVGGEVIGDFAPSFEINNALLADTPNVNSYMLNVIGAVPFGIEGRFQPYVSGGLGAIQLRSDVLNTAGVPTSGFESANEAKLGGNIGFGAMVFAQNVGVRTDVRYYRANASDADSSGTMAEQFTQNLLSGLDYWRANVGVAVRW